MSLVKRVYLSDNSTITELTDDIKRYADGSSVVADIVAAEDYLYIAQIYPFNHFYVNVSTPSVTTSNAITIEYWDGREWIEAYETIDTTRGFTRTGFITFIPKDNKGWTSESTNNNGDQITDLTTIKVYDMYWARIKFSLDIPAGFTLKYIGQKFCDDIDLGTEFPSLVSSSMYAAYGPSKTNWDEQHCLAAELISDLLIKLEVIENSGQILVKERFTKASVMKVAEIIFNSLGDDYIDQSDKASAQFKERMNLSIYMVDKNKNATLDIKERDNRTGFLSR